MSLDIYKIMARYFAAEATETERKLLAQWRSESAENQRAFEEAEKLWQTGVSGLLENLSHIEESWEQLRRRIDNTKPSSSKMIRGDFNPKPAVVRGWQWRALGVAASLIILMAFSIWYFWLANPYQEIVTQNARQKQVTLPDGSVVHLNNASKLIFPAAFSGGNRKVKLAGEAFFEVMPGEQPFIVETENAQIRVVGTKFNIWSRMQETRLIVTEGQVKFTALKFPEKSIFVEKDWMSICRENSAPETSQPVDANYRLGWLNGVIVFDQTPLAEIVAELKRIYDVNIEIKDPSLNSQTLTGSFRNRPLKQVIAAVCKTLMLQYHEEDGKIVITKK